MNLYVSVYLALGVGYCLGCGGYVWAIMVLIGPSTGRKLHRVLLQTVTGFVASLEVLSKVADLVQSTSIFSQSNCIGHDT